MPAKKNTKSPKKRFKFSCIKGKEKKILEPGSRGEDVRALQSFLTQSGYLGRDRDPNVLCPSTSEALKHFQETYNLQVTGAGDVETLELIQRPRCGVPDIEPSGEEINGLAPFTLVGCKYNTTDLTYAFLNKTEDIALGRQRKIIKEAFKVWADVSSLIFEEVLPNETPTFTISWEQGNHGDGAIFDDGGSITGNTLAHAFFPPQCGGIHAGALHFDDFEFWTDLSAPNRIRLLNVAIHEIGHLLGLRHSDNINSIMFAFYDDDVDSLKQDDINGIQALYGSPTFGQAITGQPFQFLPTANSTEFDGVPEVKAAWHTLINFFFEQNIQGTTGDSNTSAIEELKLWGRSESDLRFYNPASFPIPQDSEPANITWSALPTSFDDLFLGDERAKFLFLDTPQFDSQVGGLSRIHDEYNEWCVIKNSNGQITKVIFTSEPPEFYQFLYEDWLNIGKNITHPILLNLYRDRCDTQDVQIDDLSDPSNASVYNAHNHWNNDFCVHMQQPNNTLGAQVNIAARAAIQRINIDDNSPITDPANLIECARFGAAQRQSDPAIGAAVNAAARENKMITLENPVGLYMTGLDTSGFVSPNGDDAQSFWQVKKGINIPGNPNGTMIVRAIYSVPSNLGFTVSDITIGGAPIEFGSEIAKNINMRLGAVVSPVTNLPFPRGIGCLNQSPHPLESLRRLSMLLR